MPLLIVTLALPLVVQAIFVEVEVAVNGGRTITVVVANAELPLASVISTV